MGKVEEPQDLFTRKENGKVQNPVYLENAGGVGAKLWDSGKKQ